MKKIISKDSLRHAWGLLTILLSAKHPKLYLGNRLSWDGNTLKGSPIETTFIWQNANPESSSFSAQTIPMPSDFDYPCVYVFMKVTVSILGISLGGSVGFVYEVPTTTTILSVTYSFTSTEWVIHDSSNMIVPLVLYGIHSTKY